MLADLAIPIKDGKSMEHGNNIFVSVLSMFFANLCLTSTETSTCLGVPANLTVGMPYIVPSLPFLNQTFKGPFPVS